jgi:predicted transcriptional regulator
MAVPVVMNKRPVGIISLDDIRKVPRSARGSTKVEEVMNRDAITVDPMEEVMSALRTMVRNNMARLIVKEDERVVGVITTSDIQRAVMWQNI